MIANSGPWSIETLVIWPIGIVGSVLLLAGSAILWWLFARDGYGEIAMLASFATVACLALTFFTVWGEYPYNAEYHQWRTTSGTVTQVGSRLIGADKSTTQRFVVTLDGVGQRSCDDTRCAEVKVGDHLTLTCKRAWQYAGADGYDCNFEEVTR